MLQLFFLNINKSKGSVIFGRSGTLVSSQTIDSTAIQWLFYSVNTNYLLHAKNIVTGEKALNEMWNLFSWNFQPCTVSIWFSLMIIWKGGEEEEVKMMFPTYATDGSKNI